MSNEVDTSLDTVNAEFDAAEREIGPEEPEHPPETPPEIDPMAEAQKEAEIAMASGVIGTSLRLAIGTFSGVNVDNTLTDQAAESYAILIIKYFPGGLFALLDRYKEELTAVTATFILVKAVTDAKAKKEEEEEAKRAEKAAKKKAESTGPRSEKPEVQESTRETDSENFTKTQGAHLDG